jgi:hypothetical protein
MKRVKGVEDLNIRSVRAQGIVGVGATIPMFTVWSRQVGSHRTDADGSGATRSSSCQCGC